MKNMSAALLVACIAGSASAQVVLNEIGRIDLGPDFNSGVLGDGSDATPYGSNPVAIAWDGANLFAAGFDNFSVGPNTGIVKVTDALGAATRSQIVTRPTPDGRGYSGLDIANGKLAAAWEDGGTVPDGIAQYDATSGALDWAISARGGSGVAFDPGFGGSGAGVGWTQFGSGRRALVDSATGVETFTTGNGMIINGAGTGTFWRDMGFEADGDIWLREGNNLIKADRTGGNSVATAQLIVDATEADFVNQQNLGVVEGSGAGDFVIWNDRTSAAGGQSAASVLNVVDLDGNALSLTINLSGGGSILDGNGSFDFSYDAASGTLALLDSANRTAYIFSVVPTPASAAVLGLGGLLAVRRRR